MELSELIKFGERSRLIPVVADTSREERAVSPLLAAFAVVPSLANSMLQDVGGPTNQRATVSCYSQVVFKTATGDSRLRPDGFIEVDSGRKTWRAIVEAKIGGAELSAEQIEGYLDLARSLGIDAVITISNQFSTLPTHHPVAVNKQKLRNVELYHFSWLSLLTKARLLSDDKSVEDPEQAYILRELIRYLSHESCGVCEMTRLVKEWKEVATKVQTGVPIGKSDADALVVTSQWHQLTRYLALELSAAIGKSVTIWLTRQHAKDPVLRMTEDCAAFSTASTLSAQFEIPNAASRLTVDADFLRRSLRFSLDVNTPQDRTRPSAAINWLTRQLSSISESTDTLLRVRWPGRNPDTVGPLAGVIGDPKTVVPENRKSLPSGFQIQRIVDLAGRFRGSSTFIEDARKELPRFYKDIVQNVSNWVPKAPEYKESTIDRDTVSSEDEPNAAPIDENGEPVLQSS